MRKRHPVGRLPVAIAVVGPPRQRTLGVRVHPIRRGHVSDRVAAAVSDKHGLRLWRQLLVYVYPVHKKK